MNMNIVGAFDSRPCRTDPPKDFLGRVIKAGHVIAISKASSGGSWLERRFVREAHPDHLVVQSGPEEPTDRRGLGRVTNFANCIIVDGEPA